MTENASPPQETFIPNEAFTDFSITAHRDRFQKALDEIDDGIRAGQFSARPIIGGQEIKDGNQLKSVDPADPSITIGKVGLAGVPEGEDAIESLQAGALQWRETPAEERASILQKVAELMRERRHALAALMVREAGKPWAEADADVAEAIDFCDYYALEMIRMGQPRQLSPTMGELNYYFYQPRGIALIISPWNFPPAIPCGMTVAALVAGNVTILKPAEQTSIIAYEFAKILLEAGIPGDAFSFLPGVGEELGAALVRHPAIDIICFTGSKDVGLEIIRTAAQVVEGQRNVKKVIAEMGGKNAIIVDEDADLDEAVKGVIHSAFGYAGQKCSACSRAIIVGDAYERFLDRLCEAASDIIIGAPWDSATLVGPVIDEVSQKRVLNTIEDATQENTLAFRGQVPAVGFFVPPTIFRDVDPSSSLWREEIFAPVLACCKTESFEKALELANDSQYALTGGVFSRSPQHIQLAYRRFEVGNLYINRGTTGALVCRQPFGGFRMSGVGSKAGGPDYLIQFMEPRAISENSMRRGFTPELV